MKLRVRIFLNYSLIIFFAMAAIITVTIIYFNQANKITHKNRLQQKERAIMQDIHNVFIDKNLRINQRNLVRVLRNKIYELKAVHKTDFSIYNMQGKLLLTNIPKKDRRTDFKTQVPEGTLKSLQNSKSVSYIDDDKDDIYIPTFSYIYSKIGTPVGILHIPYAYTHKEVDDDIQSFLLYLSPWFIIFIIFSIIVAYILSQYIIKSLAQLGVDMKKNYNEHRFTPIEYNHHDEIGDLVVTYNKVQEDLAKSVELLSERKKEEAWQEMAKQVAHEIKNPLTPMRLKIQSFMMTYNPANDNNGERLKELGSSIITQIDTIREIADNFSSFAKMPEQRREIVYLADEVNNIVSIFGHKHIEISEEGRDIKLLLNKPSFHRILTNLLKNATQAKREDQDHVRIWINISQTTDKVIVSVKDDARGINEENLKRIFEPKFTTKSSGSGLGLAMVKRIVEIYEGDISIESQENVGTTVTITIPKII